MPDFNFYGGGGPTPGAIAELLKATVQAEQYAGSSKIAGAQAGSQALLGALQEMAARTERGDARAQDRSDRFSLQRLGEDAEMRKQREYLDFMLKQQGESQKFEGEQAEIGRGEARSARESQRELSTSMGLAELLQGVMQAGAAQGYPVPALAERFMQQIGQLPGLGALGGGGAGGAPRGPNVPGGYMIEPPQQDGGGYIDLARPQGPGGGMFEGLTPMQQPPGVDQQRLDREVQMDAETMAAIGEATQFARSPQGEKALYIPVKMSRLDALDLADLPPDMQEKEILRLFPQAAPSMGGMDGKEDRSKLDALIKWLSKETEIEVPNESGFLMGRQYLSQRVKSPKALSAALDAIAPTNDLRPARTLRDAREVAKEFVLNRMQEIKAAGSPAQLQGGGDLLEAMQGAGKQERLTAAAGTPMPGTFTKEFAQEVGLNLVEFPALEAAAAAKYPLGFEGGKVVFTQQGKTKPLARHQAELDKAMALPGVRERIEQKLALGAGIKQTSSEVEAGAAARRAKRDPGGQITRPTEYQGDRAPAKQAAPQAQPPMSALERWRQRKDGKAEAPKKAAPKVHPFANSSYGLVPDELMQLLLGAGGGG